MTSAIEVIANVQSVVCPILSVISFSLQLVSDYFLSREKRGAPAHFRLHPSIRRAPHFSFASSSSIDPITFSNMPVAKNELTTSGGAP